MISFDEAVGRLRRAARPMGTQAVPIAEAAGRVLAAPVIASLDSPRYDVSTMDGYAVRDADVESLPARLAVRGESFAGAGWTGSVGSGECVRIFTGARVPASGDRVIMQEEVRREGGVAVIDQPPGAARHIRTRGSDFRQGGQLLDPGRLLDKRAIVVAAGADVAELEVFARPRVAILSTGDELAEPGTAARLPDAVPDSVSLGVAAMAAEWGAAVVARERAGDELARLEQAGASAAANADLVVVTGGASVGEKDFAKAMFEPAGLELIFSKVSIKPGKPVWFGRVAGTLILGLPGNPTSALVTARLLLAPLLCALSGRDADDALLWRRAALASPLPQCGLRETFHRARLSGDAVEILGFQDSGAQRALAQADVLVRQPAGSPPIATSSLIDVLDF